MQIEICHSASAEMHTLSRVMMKSHRRRRLTGFTLIELLVVLVLLAALTALLLPAYRRAIESSKVSKDLSNLRQLGLAVHVHANEHGYIPGEQWPSLLAPAYVAAWDVFKSPFDQRSPGETNPLSYDINVNLWGRDFLSILSPPDCILLAPLTADTDTLQFASTTIVPGVPTPLCRESNGSGSSGGTAMDGRFIPVVFADLHGELLPIDAFHSVKPNPAASHPIADLRWNE